MTELNEREFWTISQLAELLGMSKLTIYRHAADGNIRSIKVGKLRRIPAEEVERIRKQGFGAPGTLEDDALATAATE